MVRHIGKEETTMNPIDLLNEAGAFLTTLTGNLSDDGLSLDHGRVREGMGLVLIEALKRIDQATAMLEARDVSATT